MIYRDRIEAAALLLEKLPDDLQRPLVLAIPRAGFRMGEWLAKKINADFDVLLVSQLTIPKYDFDWAGAISEFGFVETEPFADKQKLQPAELARLSEAEIDKLHGLRAKLTPMRSMKNPRDHDVILIDDGILTGCSLMAAIKSIEPCSPRRLIGAIAIAPRQAQDRLEKSLDKLIVLQTVNDLNSIRSYFTERSDITEDEMRESLAKFKKPPPFQKTQPSL